MKEDKNQRDLGCEPPTTIDYKAPETNHAFNQLDEALQFTRSTSAAANSATHTMAAPSVVVQPQATVIRRLGKEKTPLQIL